jgi:choline dehydrogenase-like flavoprotein
MPVLDGQTLNGVTLRADVCVIGGGPAGIVVAEELSDSGWDVVVIEAGERSYDLHQVRNTPHAVVSHLRGPQAEARGLNRGIPYYPLRMSRVRGIGGSTLALKRHGLRSRPLDAIDFEPIFSGGWPMQYEEFASYLEEAAVYCGIPGRDISWDARSPFFDNRQSNGLSMVGFRHGSRDAFVRYGTRAMESEGQRWVTSASATGFDVDASGHVTAVRAITRSQASFSVEAQAVVVACGGIDNACILLANEQLLSCMGEAADNVGRSFMEHLHYVAGYVIPNGRAAYQEIAHVFDSDDGQDPWLTISDSAVRAEGLARTVYEAVPAYVSSVDPSVSALGRLGRSLPYGPFDRSLWLQELQTALRGGVKIPRSIGDRLSPSVERTCFAVTAMSEQTPNPRSRITLSHRPDRTGLRLPVLEWRLDDFDLKSARRSAELLAGGIASADLGEFVSVWDRPGDREPVFTGGWHHMGTTMMSRKPSDGVVDPNAAVHGVPNMFIAGSSIFPTGGFANPTLSLVALSIRLARHISRQIQ